MERKLHEMISEIYNSTTDTKGELYTRKGAPLTLGDMSHLTIPQLAFYEEYGIVMPRLSLHQFRMLQEMRDEYILKPISIRYIFYITYIKLKQWKIRRAERRMR